MARNPAAVAKALIRAAAVPQTGTGGFGAPNVPATVSPLVASYGDWTSGRVAGPGLVRDWQTFLSGTFGPLAPMRPIPIDTPPEGQDQAPPRRFTYPVSWNLPHGVPGDEGLKLAAFAQLRTIAETYSVARACVQTRIAEIVGLDWDIVPTKDAEKAMRQDKAAHKDFSERKAKLVSFFQRPDPGKYHNFNSWLNAVLEDLFVVDALSLYLQPPRVKGKGVLGSNLAALCVIAGDLVRPMLDMRGGIPQPPNVSFQIYQYGVPRVDLMTAIAGTDLEGLGTEVAQYRGDQLLYLPYVARSWTPYGFPPVERALVPILSGIQRQQWQLDYYSAGSVPGVFISAGDPNATPNQLRELQDALNAMAGDPAWKHKIIVLPKDSHIEPMRATPLSDQFDEMIVSQVCMAFDVMPMELGITPRSSTSGHSSGAQNQMGKQSESTNERKALKPLLKWLKTSIFDYVIQGVCGQDDMQWMWEGLEEDEDEEKLVNTLIAEMGHGLRSIDEARIIRGEQPWGLPLTSDPVYFTGTGVTPIGAIDPATGQPAPAPTPPPAGPPGAPPTGSAPAAPGSPPKPKPSGGEGTTSAATPAHAGAQAAAQTKPQRPAQTGKPSQPAKPVTKSSVEPPVAMHAALRELDLIRRRLNKGRALNGWQPEHIPADVFATLAETANTHPDKAIDQARWAVKTAGRRQLRDTSTAHLTARVADGLKDLAIQLGDGKISTPAFVDAGVELLRTAIHEAMLTGHGHASGGESVTKAWTDPLNGRWQQYAGAVPQAYEHGYGLATLGAAANPDDVLIRWHAKPDACVLCSGRDGQLFTTGSLPGWPGDGGFGKEATVCLGSVNCRCSLEYVPFNPDLLAELAPVTTLGTPAQQDIAADILAVRRAVDTGDTAQVDAALAHIAGRKAEVQRPFLMGLLQDVLSAISRGVTAFRDWLTKGFDPAEARDEHGRWTIVGAAMHGLEDLLGSTYTQDELEGSYGEGVDSALFADGAYVELGQRGDVHIDLAGNEQGKFHVFADMGQDEAQPLADAIWWALNRADEGGHRPSDPLNGLQDWVVTDDEKVVGYTHDGHIRVGHISEDRTVPALELTLDQAAELARGLEYVSGIVIEDEEDTATKAVASPVRKVKRWDGPCRLPVRRDPAAWYLRAGHEFTPTSVVKNASDVGDPNPVEAEHVLSLMRQNFPDKALNWVSDARWIGPVEIPQDRIDDDDMRSWAATRDKDRVRHFVRRMRSGDEPHPAILVQEPGETRAKVIDGHHRTLAARRLDRPVRAYVGFVDADGGPWDQTHSYQFHQGGDPANKAFDPHEVRVPRGAPGGGRWVKVADWVHVGDHKVGEQVHHPEHGAGVVREVGKTTTRVDFGGGKRLTFARKPKAGATEHFTPKPVKTAGATRAAAPRTTSVDASHEARIRAEYHIEHGRRKGLWNLVQTSLATGESHHVAPSDFASRKKAEAHLEEIVATRLALHDREKSAEQALESRLREKNLERVSHRDIKLGDVINYDKGASGPSYTVTDVNHLDSGASVLYHRGQTNPTSRDQHILVPSGHLPIYRLRSRVDPAPAGITTRPPAMPTPIHDLLTADDATIEKALRDVFEGKFGPYTTKVRVHIRRAGTRVDNRDREHIVEPRISIEGDIFDPKTGAQIGNFGRSISPVNSNYRDANGNEVQRREVWAEHHVVQLGEGDYDTNPTKYHGKGFGGAFNRRAIEWYRASGVHGISQSDHNGYVWASQGFNFSGGQVPDYLANNMRRLVADLRAGRRTSDAAKEEYRTIPKRFRDAPDLAAQFSEVDALLARLETTKPGQPDYPTAYEISQLGRRAGQRGKTALWLGKLLWVSADELVLNPNEGEVISS